MKDLKEDTIAELKRYIETDVAVGFADADNIVECAVEVLSDEASSEALRPLAIELTRQALDQHLQTQLSWPTVTDCDRLDAAFAELEQQGIVSRQHFSCCGTCGLAEIGDEIQTAEDSGIQARGYTFYHWQDSEAAAEGRGLYLFYGSIEEEETEPTALLIGREVADTLRRHDLQVDWDGQWSKRIGVGLDWKRRRSLAKEAS